ncbi:Leucine-rich repeat transmembrane protein kinase family protein [Dorcoceras hygrometricum]|uniref:Leucine-rich repeat transmembrane protein kinase family protein n=1 Tax=Dorcoceras hygrometricum TaxID=472368 RepID=A0A2Z7C5V7_9LAMI|nr:Leucine-rich repeat transmembrane protein kinase family protein [Dorcoceras hygrometricum]
MTAAKPNPLMAAAFFLLLIHCAAAVENPDIIPLLRFKSIADPNGAVLTSWNSSSDPCTSSWVGISCLRKRVTRLVLENFDFNGTFPQSFTSLTQLRVLSLKENGFSGPIPDLSNLTSLKLLFVSHNRFSGEFPASLTSLTKLYRLDLSFNSFSGNIPLGLNRLTHLLTLKLEENLFTGPISGLSLPNLQDFNVSGNRLTGEIPVSLSGFSASSFLNNPVLCGLPLEKCKVVASDPSRPGGAMASPLTPRTTVASSPTAMPTETRPPIESRSSHRNKISSLAIIAIILGDVLVLGLVSLLLYCYFWRNYSHKLLSGKNSGSDAEKIVYSSSPYPNPAQQGNERGKMVFFDGERRFELEDLLRASAEMLGKGGFGTAYKAILDDGNVVAVKRLKDLNVNGKKEFEQQMEILGRLRHSNLVSLKAYYFARDEKLLVYDYMPNGNLFWLLHGNRGPGRTPLDWTTRLKIAAGAARGLAFVHSQCKSLKLTHGNIKSTNILIDKEGNARVSDFGLSVFASPSLVPKSNGYRAPEAALDGRKLTQKSDVYSFGVLLLELLTGKSPSAVENNGPTSGYSGVIDLPRWVQSVVREEWTAEVFDLELMRYKDIEEEMVGLLQIALSCTQATPDQRPKMNYVLKMIEELRGSVSPSHDNLLDSVSESPSISEDTCRASE